MRVLVAGAGAAGLVAAVTAAQSGARVRLLEPLDRVGAKLLSTGGGRCNLTNLAPPEEYYRAFGPSGRFMSHALEAMPPEATVRVFESLGVRIAVEGRRAWPASGRAAEIRDALLTAANEAGVKIVTGARVEKITVEGGAVVGVEAAGRAYECDALVLATGGLARAELGSRGDGFRLARDVGHSVVEPVPALVPLVAVDEWPGRLAGIALTDAEFRVKARGRGARAVRGEVLFTHTGVSGPAVLDVSGHVARLLHDAKGTAVPAELAPLAGVGRSEWEERLALMQAEQGARPASGVLARDMPSRLAEMAAELAGVEPETKPAALGRHARGELARVLGGMPMTIARTAGFEKAMATSGGVSLKEIDPRDMSSRFVRGLYFAGEVVDLDGPCGGYNLQWAFASGMLAGESACRLAQAGG